MRQKWTFLLKTFLKAIRQFLLLLLKGMCAMNIGICVMKFFPMFYVGPLITEIGLNDENDLDKPYKLVETAEIG